MQPARVCQRCATAQWGEHLRRQDRCNRARSRSGSIRRDESLPCHRMSATTTTTSLRHTGVMRSQTSQVGHVWDRIHPSHKRWMIGGLVFCRDCGYWMCGAIHKLRDPCIRAPANSTNRYQRDRMLNGMHPDRRARKWPSGYPANVLMRPRPLDQ